MDDPTRTTEPHDDLTRLADEMVEAFRGQLAGTHAIVMLTRDKAGGLGLFGYENDTDAFVDLMVFAKMILRANGKDLQVLPMGIKGQG